MDVDGQRAASVVFNRQNFIGCLLRNLTVKTLDLGAEWAEIQTQLESVVRNNSNFNCVNSMEVLS